MGKSSSMRSRAPCGMAPSIWPSNSVGFMILPASWRHRPSRSSPARPDDHLCRIAVGIMGLVPHSGFCFPISEVLFINHSPKYCFPDNSSIRCSSGRGPVCLPRRSASCQPANSSRCRGHATKVSDAVSTRTSITAGLIPVRSHTVWMAML